MRVWILLILSTFVLIPTPIYAYVDPGTAGLLYQVVYAFVLSAVAWFAGIRPFIKGVWRRITGKKSEDEKL